VRSTFICAGAALACAASPLACSSDPAALPADAGISLGDGGYVDAPDQDAHKPRVDGGFEAPDGGVLREDRFVTKVVSFTPGTCAGFGAAEMPAIVQGPPVGAGDLKGSFDVVSLGIGGEIVLSVEPNAIIDGPGADFIVFENAFYASGDPTVPAADLAEVSVSDDGTTWKTYPCTPGPAAPHGACAGWHPVYSAPGNGISPVDPAKAGGEAYDLSTVGLASARFIRIKDLSTSSCDVMPRPINAGFDLDGVAIVNAKTP
jgi:hypothetical protein